MRRLIAILTVLLVANTIFAQWGTGFEYSNLLDDHIIIDTVSNPNNIWQIGVPDKTVFDSAYSGTHVIVTDTLNPYPTNDTSSFIFKYKRPEPLGLNVSVQLNFWFKINSDSLQDFGMVEVSIDNGATWINLMTDDTYDFQWLDPKPILTGNSDGWEHFSLELISLTDLLGYSDTLSYRFTFISDSIQTNKDGWMLDNLSFVDGWLGVEEHSNNDLINIYPNPSSGEISIVRDDKTTRSYQVEIIDISGKTVLEKENISNKLKLNLPNGLYFLKLTDKENIYIKKLIIDK